jgi:RNA polymerase sigma-70 factor, ECF subfamily
MLVLGSSDQGAMFRELSDSELVGKAVRGDKEAYRCLVERYQRKMLALGYEITQSREDAEDVVQEGFVKAYLSLGSFKGEAAFYTWLYRIVYNMAIDLRRKHSRRGGAAVEFDETSAQGAAENVWTANGGFESAPEMMIRKENMRRFGDLMAEMSEDHRSVILLREVEGMSYDQIARVLGINKGTVMSRLFYARKRLQKGLQEEERAAAGEVAGAALKTTVK